MKMRISSNGMRHTYVDSRWVHTAALNKGPIRPCGQMLSHNQYTKNVLYPDFPLLGLIEDTLWLFNIAMDNGPFIDDLPITNGDFPWLC